MHGNVWEWCEDVWQDNYTRAGGDGTACTQGDDKDKRVIRGGDWKSGPNRVRSAYRTWNFTTRLFLIGHNLSFRLAHD